MGKPEKGTPKFLANKMKSKGLQKLRWYCQMCQKQCRDENGFKCHTSSESHQRQLLLFADNPRRYLDEFSKDFSDGYMELLRRRFGTKRVFANAVYQEYIAHKEHVHMNATKWLSLGGFVKWLGKTGKCIVDETEKGWYVTYIDRDPDTIARQKALEKKVKMDLDDEERLRGFIEKQVERAKETEKFEEKKGVFELHRTSEDELIKLRMEIKGSKKKEDDGIKLNMKLLGFNDEGRKVPKPPKHSSTDISSSSSCVSYASAVKDLTFPENDSDDPKKNRLMNRRDYWLHEGIIVKVITKSLGDKYFNQKGVVLRVIDKYAGIIKIHDTGAKLKLDQNCLQTVLPSEGQQVLVLNGKYRGFKARMVSIQIETYSVTIEIQTPFEKETLSGIKYEDICKMAN